jgi:hypothetical protein
VAPASTTVYVLTAKRGAQVAYATNMLVVVAGVAASWDLLDNFDAYTPGLLSGSGWWVEFGQQGNSFAVVEPSGSSINRMLTCGTNQDACVLNLSGLAIQPSQARTLFFRVTPQAADPAETIAHFVGISDKQCNFFYQVYGNGVGFGPALFCSVNDPSQNLGDWLLSAQNGQGAGFTFAPNTLQTNIAYNVWIDITNVPMVNPWGSRTNTDEDVFTVYIQAPGEPGRTLLFSNYVSDRDLNSNDSLTGGIPTDPLTRLYVTGDANGFGTMVFALFDDFYLSRSGYNATVPIAAGYAGPPPSLQLQRSGSQSQVLFQGALQAAPVVIGTYTNVPGATSPYLIPTGEAKKFYRAVFN